MSQIDIKIKTLPDLSGLTKLGKELSGLSKIEAFRKLKESAQKANQAWKDAESGVRALSEKIKQTKAPTRAMSQEFNRAKQQAANLKAEFLKQQKSLNSLKSALTSAGIDTAKLSAEHKRLKTSLTESNAEALKVAKINAARGTLEVESHRKTHREIEKLTAAYNRLKKSGKLSMQELAQAQYKLRSRTEALKESMNGWTTTIGRARLGLLAMTGVIYGVARAQSATVGKFMDFDDTMRQVGAVSGATGKQLDNLRELALKMGRETRYSASQAAEGLKFLSMAGFKADKSIKALPGVLQLAAAGSLDLGRAADITTNVLTGFGLGVDQLNRVNNVLVKAFTSSNSTLEDLGTAFTYVGPIAAGVGADFEDLVAALGQLHNAGIKGSMAGTGLRGALDALLNPTNEEAKLMDELSSRIGGTGLQIYDSQGKFIGFTKIVEQLEIAGITGAEALKLFGQRAGPGMQALVKIGSDSLKNFRGDLKGAVDEDIAGKIASNMEAGIGGAVREMKSALEGLAITIGDDLAPIIMVCAKAVKVLSTGMSETDTTTKYLLYSLGTAGTIFAMWKLGLKTLVYQFPLIRAEINATAISATRLGLAMKGALAVGAIYGAVEIIRLGMEIYKLNKVMREHQEIANKEGQAAQKFVQAKDVQIKTSQQLAKMTNDEKQAYVKNLSAATQYYSHLTNQANFLKDDAMLGGLLPFQSQKGRENEERLKEVSKKSREYANALMQARQAGVEVKQATVETTTVLATMQEQYTKIGESAEKAYKNAVKAAKDYEKELKDIDAKLLDSKASMEDRIRAIRQRSMDDSTKQIDYEKQASEKLAAAKKALQAGDKERAVELAEQSARIAESLDNEQAAIKGVEQAYKFLETFYKGEKSTLQEKLKASQKDAETLKTTLEELAQARDAKVTVTLEKLNEAKAALDRWLKEPATKTVKIKTVEQKSIGGPVGFSRGGGLPGYGGGDRISAILEAGEFVMRKEAVKRYGAGLFQRLNSLSLTLPSFSIPAIPVPQIPRFAFAAGGMVPGGVKDMGKIDIQVKGKGYPVMAQVDVISELKTALRKENLLRGN